MNIKNPLNKLASAFSTFANEVATEVKATFSKGPTIHVVLPSGVKDVTSEEVEYKAVMLEDGLKEVVTVNGDIITETDKEYQLIMKEVHSILFSAQVVEL